MTARRGVGGAAQGSANPSPSSSLGVSIPYSDATTVAKLRYMLRNRDRKIEEIRYVKDWYGHFPELFRRLDEERRLIRCRMKLLASERKQKPQ